MDSPILSDPLSLFDSLLLFITSERDQASKRLRVATTPEKKQSILAQSMQTVYDYMQGLFNDN